ncbi:MAG TPA: hypothetical protein VGJ84_10430 [Polyangiaceae bacterium]|jgi:hypothetical protein
MSERRSSILRTTVTLLCIGVTVAGLINVFGDDSAVRALAESTACRGQKCSAQITHGSRNPIQASFTFQTTLTEPEKPPHTENVDVDCQRSYWLVGDYKCERKSYK